MRQQTIILGETLSVKNLCKKCIWEELCKQNKSLFRYKCNYFYNETENFDKIQDECKKIAIENQKEYEENLD